VIFTGSSTLLDSGGGVHPFRATASSGSSAIAASKGKNVTVIHGARARPPRSWPPIRDEADYAAPAAPEGGVLEIQGDHGKTPRPVCGVGLHR